MAVRARRKDERLGVRSDAGFTLIELVVAMMLLTVGVLSVSQVLVQSVSMQTAISLRETALDVARSYMEEVKVRDPSTLVSEATVTVNEVGVASVSGLFTRTLTVESVAPHLVEVTVTVTSPRSSGIELVTIVWDGVV